MNKDYLNDVANYIISGHSIAEAMVYFSKSESSIKKYLQAIRDVRSPHYNEILAKKLQLVQARIILEGQKKGGSVGKRDKTYSDEEARKLASMYLSGHTFESLNQETKIPVSTLHNIIRSIDDDTLQAEIDKYIHGTDEGMSRR